MTIDIQRTVIKIQLRRFITIIIFTLGALIIMLGGSLQHNFMGITKYQWALIVGVFYALVATIEAILELNYIYFSNTDDKIVLRYFSMGFFNRRKHSIEIPIDRFSGYILKKSFWGIKKKLVLIQRIKNVDAKYPPVSITALKKEELKRILHTLDGYR